MTDATGYRPRFQRSADLLPTLQITERDTEILRQLASFRFLDSRQIVALVGGSRFNILRRLQRLYHLGYVERPRAQIDTYHTSGSRPMVYGLGKKGAAHLRRASDLPFDRIDWTEKNRSVGRILLDHTLMTSEIMLRFELARREMGNVNFLHRTDLVDLCENGHLSSDIFHWKVLPSGESRRLAVIPDQTFAFEVTESENRLPVFCFLESDRSTMPVVRSDLAQSSLYKKLISYAATWEQNVHRTELRIERFRVLIVTTSKERVEHLVEASHLLPQGTRLVPLHHYGIVRRVPEPFQLRLD